MILIPIIISMLVGLIFISLVAGVIYLIVQKKTPEQVNTPSKHIKFQDIVSNFFSLALLVTNVTAIITVAFTYIEEIFGDNLNFYSYNQGHEELHSAISLLAITVPSSLILTYWMKKQEKNESLEKFAVYATIIATTLTIAGSVFSIIFSYLEGSLTAQFMYKVLSVFVIAIGIFAYYKFIYNSPKKNFGVIAITIATIVVLVLSIVTLNKTGTPNQIRKEKFDEKRLNDLSTIQSSILNYWQSHKQLPNTLAEMSDPLYQTAIPKDPKTNEQYKYEIIKQSEIIKNRPTSASFKVCANFEAERKFGDKFETKQIKIDSSMAYGGFENYYPGSDSPFWDHGIGEKCFTRELDPKIHLPVEPTPVAIPAAQ